MNDTFRVKMQEDGCTGVLPFNSEITLPMALIDAGMMLWVAPWPSFQFPRGAVRHLLGDCDGMECSHESVKYAKVVKSRMTVVR